MNREAARQPARLLKFASFLALGLAAVWLWSQWCRFPWSAWNDVRLVPSFMLAAGEPVYSAPGAGVISTWMYGPVPVWLLLPATWMPDIESASLVAGAINIGLPLLAIAVALVKWPANETSLPARLLAAVLVLAVWPESSWRFLQSDNFAVALGLVASVLLLHPKRPAWSLWLAAFAATAAVGCKQTSLGLPVAHFIWLGLAHGRRDALEHTARLAACGGALVIATLACFDPAGLWDTLVRIPGALPLTDDAGGRLLSLSPLLAVHLGLPAALLFSLRKQPDLRGARRLAGLLWACSLPLGVVSILKIGGTLNSLQGLQLALPGLALATISALNRRSVPVTLALAASLILAWWIHDSGAPMRPRIQHLREGVALARAFPGELWFPWHPLVSYYAEGRFYHAEDGFYARLIAGRALDVTQIRTHLPAKFRGLAEPAGVNGWGISERVLGQPYEESFAGLWRLRLTRPEPANGTASP
jgi:hypothetical protein